VLQHMGGGVAPWNVQQYELIIDQKNTWWVKEMATTRREKLCFYHFHYVKFLKRNKVDISGYRIDHADVFSLYADYLIRLKQANADLLKFNLINPPQPFRTKRAWLTPLEKLIREWKGVYNVFDQNAFIEKWRI